MSHCAQKLQCPRVCACGEEVRAEEASVREANLRIFKHEAETPARGHDSDGRCCIAAKLGLGEGA